jgi:hypothetical protein
MARAIFSSCTATSDTVSDSKVMRMLGGLQYKGNLQDDLVCDDLVVPDSDFLLLAPCTLISRSVFDARAMPWTIASSKSYRMSS